MRTLTQLYQPSTRSTSAAPPMTIWLRLKRYAITLNIERESPPHDHHAEGLLVLIQFAFTGEVILLVALP